MSEFKVKTELPASRCEICHQSDLFDPEKGYCLRCKNIVINKEPKPLIASKKPKQQEILNKKLHTPLGVSSFLITTALILTSNFGLFSFITGIISSYLLAIIYAYTMIALKDLHPWIEKIPTFSITTTSEFTELDHIKLQQYSFEIKALGFIRLGDYKTDFSEEIKSFSRIFFHPQYQCFATIDQFFSSSKAPLPIALAITSNMEQDWSFASIQISNPVLINQYIYRLPKRFWVNHSLATVKEMLDSHITTRNKMLKDLQINLLANLSLKEFFEISLKVNQEFKDLHKNRRLISLLKDQLFLKAFPKTQWFGDYKP